MEPILDVLHPVTRVVILSFDHAHPNTFQSNLTLHEFVLTCKNQAIFFQRYRRYAYFSSIDIVNLKIMQSDWTRGFWLISQKSNFSRIWDLCRILANINFHYRPNSDEINDYFFQYIFKILFLANFWIFETKFCHQKIWLCHAKLHMGF